MSFNANYEQATSYAADALSLRRRAHSHLRMFKSGKEPRDYVTFKILIREALFMMALAANRMNKTRGY